MNKVILVAGMDAGLGGHLCLSLTLLEESGLQGIDYFGHTYTGCDDDVPMTFYEIVGGGHTWPDSPLAEQLADLGFFTDDISATEDGWAFMSQHTL